MSDGGDEEGTDKLEAEAASEAGSVVVSEDGANSDATGMSEEEAQDNAATEEFLRRFEVVETDEFSAVQIPPKLAVLMFEKWQAFLENFPTREQAGEAIYDQFMEEAPSLRPLFKTPRSVFGLRFIASLTNLMAECGQPESLKRQVETMGFQHLDSEVTPPRVDVIRDAILGVMESELGQDDAEFDKHGRDAFRALLNYIGGSFIFVTREFAGRIRIIQRSWKIANSKDAEFPDPAELQSGTITASAEIRLQEQQQKKQKEEEVQEIDPNLVELSTEFQAAGDVKVPDTFPEMCLFNAAVMGYSSSKWMRLVLTHWDAMATNVANTYRLQEECDVCSLVLAKYKGTINLYEFKAVMLSSLRSVLPAEWDMDHEVAWNWLWDNVERMLKAMIGLPSTYEKAIRNMILDLSEESRDHFRKAVFSKFFSASPAGSNWLKQSTGRLYFIADRIMEISLEMLSEPHRMVDEISALGLRHVGYGVPTEFFPPLVAAYVEAIREIASNETAADAFRWSLNLAAKMLVRVILEGSTVVMKAINVNSELSLRKAIAVAPRGRRAKELLEVSCGTQSISPLYWALESGSFDSARAMLQDLLTIRADRDVYYYGYEELFQRHQDLIQKLCMSAPLLLETLFDGLIWRSRSTTNGWRRVNYYVKWLIQDVDGKFSQTLTCLVENKDPHVVSHPSPALAADLLWFRFAMYYFLGGRLYLLFTLCVFVSSQAILGKHGGPESLEENIAIFACRCFLYFGSMCLLLYHQVKSTYVDIKNGAIDRNYFLPIPEYLFEFKEAARLGLVLTLIIMFFLEPILWCLSSTVELGTASNDEGQFMFSGACQSKQDADVYCIFSCIAMLLYWALLMDFAVMSMQVSAFMLACSRVVSELVLFGLALGFLILAFATAISSLNHTLLEYDGVFIWVYSLLKISLGMFPPSSYATLTEYVPVLVAVSVFVTLIFVVLLNLLVAQLTGAYQTTFRDMQGYARLNRAYVIVCQLDQVTQKSWNRFLASLKLEEPLEFNEGDIGVPGGIQILEPANASTVTEDSIKRYGGATAPSMPWPEDEAAIEEDRFDRLEKLLIKAHKRNARAAKKNGSASKSNGGSSGGSVSGVGESSSTS